GSQGVSAPVWASTAARLLRTVPLIFVNLPPKYTRLLSSDRVIADTAVPLSGAGVKPGSTVPSLWTAASFGLACPPIELKSPATQTVPPSFDTATALTAPPDEPALHSGAPLGSTAASPFPAARYMRLPSGAAASACTAPV